MWQLDGEESIEKIMLSLFDFNTFLKNFYFPKKLSIHSILDVQVFAASQQSIRNSPKLPLPELASMVGNNLGLRRPS